VAGRATGAAPARRSRPPGAGMTLDTATVSAVHPAGPAAPEVSVAAAGEVAPSRVNSLLSTVQSARYVPLGSTPPGNGRESAEVAASTAAHAAAPKGAEAGAKPTARPSTTPVPAPPRTETGDASWYQAAPGTCAHPSLPFGTVVTIVDVANGHTATCTVDDRGPYHSGRIIDLSYDVFEKLAPVGLGIVDVRLSW
jgi:rare lipoprotein A (peptidoglycan hydrolase)